MRLLELMNLICLKGGHKVSPEERPNASKAGPPRMKYSKIVRRTTESGPRGKDMAKRMRSHVT